MANFTPNYNLKKPLGSENYNVADQNGNMDAIDTALNGIDNGLAIVSTGNTHAAVTAGQYVYVRRHGSLAEGLYKANSNIAANATLTSSNLSSVSGGLGGEVSSLNRKMNSYSVCNIASFGQYIDSNGSLQTLDNYYVAEIPVTPNQTIKVLNSAPNAGAYSKFADASGNQVGDLVQGRWSPGWSSSVKVPSGAVKLQVSMYTETRYVAVEQS